MTPNILDENYIEIKGAPFIIDLMYAKAGNIAGCNAYTQIGFSNRAFVHIELWNKLKNTIPYLQKHNLKMKIFDAYRPPLAHKMLKETVSIDGFFAANPERSPHCRAIAIDVCLCDSTGTELKYPTKVDAYTPYFAEQIQQGKTDEFKEHLKKAHHDYQNENMAEEIQNRTTLRTLMESIGLKSLPHEWWHYNLVDRKDYELYPMVYFE